MDHATHNRQAEERIKSNVKKFGCHIVIIESEGYGPSFAYTIGLWETYQHAELIMFGLKPEVMAEILNEFKAEIAKGKQYLQNEKYLGFIERFEVQMLAVQKENYPDYLGYAGWYYDQTWNFPVLQILFPDHSNRWPWEEQCDPQLKYIQPLLDRNANFKFYEAPNVAAFTTRHSFEGKPILHVTHDTDGTWQFHTESSPDIADCKIVSLKQIIDLDPTLNEIFYLNYGEYAERTAIGEKWSITKMTEEEEDAADNTSSESQPSTQNPTGPKGLWGRIKGLWS
ncbi:MAG TPA: DUF4262 domain-containing protein [Bacteroidia bacterium]|nr:DUF4262 domain-containing protein [Bacteroidia bacterium]